MMVSGVLHHMRNTWNLGDILSPGVIPVGFHQVGIRMIPARQVTERGLEELMSEVVDTRPKKWSNHFIRCAVLLELNLKFHLLKSRLKTTS